MNESEDNEMITAETIKNAIETIHENWGDEVILACHKAEPISMSADEFLKHCTCCGGNWGGMLLTGIKELRPEVWEAIPDDMGTFAWQCICYTLVLLNVDTTSDD